MSCLGPSSSWERCPEDRVEHPKHWKQLIWLEFKTLKRIQTDAFSFEQSISSWSQISWLAMDFKDLWDFLTFQQSKKPSIFFQDLVLLRAFPTFPLGCPYPRRCSWVSHLKGAETSWINEDCITSTSPVPRPMQFHSILSHCLNFSNAFCFVLRGEAAWKPKRTRCYQFTIIFPTICSNLFKRPLAILESWITGESPRLSFSSQYSESPVQLKLSACALHSEHPNDCPKESFPQPRTGLTWVVISLGQSTGGLERRENLWRKKAPVGMEKLRIHTSPSQPSKMKQRKGKAIRRPRWTLAFAHQPEDLKNEAKNIKKVYTPWKTIWEPEPASSSSILSQKWHESLDREKGVSINSRSRKHSDPGSYEEKNKRSRQKAIHK